MAIDKISLCISAIIALSILQGLIYRKKEHKAKLAILVPISFIYCIVADVFFIRYYAVLFNFMNSHGYGEYSVLCANVLIVVVYCVLKLLIARLIIKRIATPSYISRTVSELYEYDDLYDRWFLRREWVNYRSFINVIRWVVIVTTGVIIAISDNERFVHIGEYSESETNGSIRVAFIVFTCAAVLLINELYHFVNGETKQEYEHSVSGMESESRRMGQFFRVREIYEKMLPEPLLSAQTGFELAGKISSDDIVKELASSDDKTDRITAKYFQAGNRYMDTETDGVKMTLDLMHRKNTVVFNPFYQDLDDYVTLPIVNTLISGKKCAVVTGRMSTKEDVQDWLHTIIGEYTHMPSLWSIKELSRVSSVCDIGIISYPELYDNTIITENADFLERVDFVLLIEPSLMLSTGQIALGIFAHEMEKNGKKPVYFVCDKPCDGLVDTISHVLRSEFTHVIGAPVPRCVYTGMAWDSSGDFARQQLFDRETRYLGNGIELAAIAIKNQIPHVNWYGEKKVPLKDIKWIAGQSYSIICQYMNVSIQQKSLFDRIEFVPNMWKATKAQEQFAIVEDGFNNMFAMLHTFLSRGIYQSFINVLSDNYLLRDYMRCNQQMFLSNHSAIPSFVPDYAKTERNTLIKLVLSMAYRQVSDVEVLDEFHLVGVESNNGYDLLTDMLSRYTDADRSVLDIETRRVETDVLTKGEVNYYSISEDAFKMYFGKSLEKAFYIIEEETGEKEYVDAKLFSHVTQNHMVGQFVVYDGKYYQVRHISPNTGVVLRRAADLFDRRKHYRQFRKYELYTSHASVMRSRLLSDIEITIMECDIRVSTNGYLEQTDIHDLRKAKYVDLSDDPSIGNYSRSYKNKALMRIKLPECDKNTCFTLSMLLMESFRTMFPDGYPYLSVTTKCPEYVEGMLNYLVHPITGDVDDGFIYIVEDSDIDLGLIETIDRNIEKIMEIVADYLSWHFEKMREPESKDPIPPSYTYDAEKIQKNRQKLFEKMANRIRKLMGGKKEKPISFDDIEKELAEKTISINEVSSVKSSSAEELNERDQNSSDKQINISNSEEITAQKSVSIYSDVIPSDIDNPDQEIIDVDGTDIFDETGEVDDNLLFDLEFQAHGLAPITRTRYQRECFLKFGYEEIDKRLHIDEVMKYLRVHGWTDNALTSARKREVFEKTVIDVESDNHCDFCGRALSGASYELLNDGRIRCNDCSASAITTVDELRYLFYQTLELMESFYGIKYRIPLSISMVDARTLAKAAGRIFRPSKDFAARTLGFAQRRKGKMGIMMENGSPRLGTIETMTHELTHIWQYMNWNDDVLNQVFDMGDEKLTAFAVLMVYEGMAVWSAIQYLYQIGETKYAQELEIMTENMNDEYGWGFMLYREQYPLIKDAALIRLSPFESFPPIDPNRVREIMLELLENGRVTSLQKEYDKYGVYNVEQKKSKQNDNNKTKQEDDIETVKESDSSDVETADNADQDISQSKELEDINDSSEETIPDEKDAYSSDAETADNADQDISQLKELEDINDDSEETIPDEKDAYSSDAETADNADQDISQSKELEDINDSSEEIVSDVNDDNNVQEGKN